MDSTNGHSEKNQDKKREENNWLDKVNFEQTGDLRKIDLSELPFKDQEQIREFMAMTGDDEEPEIFIADFSLKFENAEDIPMDFLADMYRDSIQDGKYEDASELGEEIKKRGYTIDISEKFITLRKEKQ